MARGARRVIHPEEHTSHHLYRRRETPDACIYACRMAACDYTEERPPIRLAAFAGQARRWCGFGDKPRDRAETPPGCHRSFWVDAWLIGKPLLCPTCAPAGGPVQ